MQIYVRYIPRTLNLEINRIIMKHEAIPEKQVQCPVCGSWKKRLEVCCDESDNAPIRDEDDARTWEPDYD